MIEKAVEGLIMVTAILSSILGIIAAFDVTEAINHEKAEKAVRYIVFIIIWCIAALVLIALSSMR